MSWGDVKIYQKYGILYIWLIYKSKQVVYVLRLSLWPSIMSEAIIVQKVVPCNFCDKHFEDAPSCIARCNFCSAIHMKSDLVDGQCPRMNGFARELKDSIPCQKCEEAEQECERMVKQMMEKMGINEKQNSNSVHVFDCYQCKGTKKQPLVVDCSCNDGCSQCGYLKVQANPVVKSIHMRPRLSLHGQECAICLQMVNQGDPIFRMQCTHQFHFLCLAEWVVTKKKQCCPCCRHTDLFLQVDTLFEATVAHFRKEQGVPEPQLRVHINADGEIVEGDQDSEYSQDSDYAEFEQNPYDDSIYDH